MGNLKHAIAASMAVVMVSSLAVKQATDISPASANRLAENTQNGTPTGVQDTTQVNWNAELPAEYDILFNPVLRADGLMFRPFAGYVVSKDGAAVWATPERKESIGLLTCGEEIAVIREMADWYVVKYKDQEAYMPKEVVTNDYDRAKEVLLAYYMFETGTVKTEGESLNIRSGASTEGTLVIDQADDGDMIVVLERIGDDWMQVYYGKNYQTGYVKSEYVEISGMELRSTVNTARASRLASISKPATVVSGGKTVNILAMPSDKEVVVGTLKDGVRCSVLEKGANWTKIVFGEDKSIGYVKSGVILTDAEKAQKEAAKAKKAASAAQPAVARSGSATGQAIVNEAKKYLGVPYVYGGSSPSGFDCSGLVQYVCRNVGITVNRSSRSQYSNGVAVSKSNLQPGDLVFFSKGGSISHVGIYAGDGQVIHSPRPGKKVCYVSLDSFSSYSTYVGARRVV